MKKVVGSRFIIVSGDLSYRTIQDFLAEFYHPNHNKGESISVPIECALERMSIWLMGVELVIIQTDATKFSE